MDTEGKVLTYDTHFPFLCDRCAVGTPWHILVVVFFFFIGPVVIVVSISSGLWPIIPPRRRLALPPVLRRSRPTLTALGRPPRPLTSLLLGLPYLGRRSLLPLASLWTIHTITSRRRTVPLGWHWWRRTLLCTGSAGLGAVRVARRCRLHLAVLLIVHIINGSAFEW